MKLDPTRTKMLRLQYSRQLTKLYKNLQRRIVPILTQYTINMQEKIRQMEPAMDTWLDMEIERTIYDPSENIIRDNIRKSYQKGKHDAQRKQHKPHPETMLTRLDWEALIILQNINFNRIKDCTSHMKQAITYSINMGVMEGWGIKKITQEIRRNIVGNNTMGITRARTIARTEIINAYNTAELKQYKKDGLSDNEIIWVTSFDERTCDICSANDGKTFKQIGARPPSHPNCRCDLAPNPKK